MARAYIDPGYWSWCASAYSPDALEKLRSSIFTELAAAAGDACLVKASKREPHPYTASCGYCRTLPGFCPTHPWARSQRYELWVRPGNGLAEQLGARAGQMQYDYYCLACVVGGGVLWAPEVRPAAVAIRTALSEGREVRGVHTNGAGNAARRQEWVMNEGESESEAGESEGV
ncbi:hypothetical protein GPECTOR_138g663 [Gonium pectorale]|uniref:Uncharacterized protein n=1 Tax=Gonium pectorale TaxID=33097 RepID=A0A150FY40_GONPE|nr:hypothetical protein GPECTOR_138g663 [Gonium pectorale]|eukprot:KXZ42532.1 hypothetical protein GPECTOR_138g663 [Gonium pectorale]